MVDFNNLDLSSLRIEKELLDGKYYYSLVGMPREILNAVKSINDGSRVIAHITVTNDDPTWIISCFVSDSLVGPRFRSAKLILKEPFNVKLKNGSKLSDGTKFNHFDKWDEEEDGNHCCIKYFAVGYPKRSHISSGSQPTGPLSNNDEACFVYVMRNNENGAYKIGISRNPEYREHTLQSQEPDVTCIFQLEFRTRDIAREVERNMHLKYAEYHMRGEWYAIPHQMINQVMQDIVKCSY